MAEKHLVGIGDIAISDAEGDVITAPNLGSCLGISAYDPEAKIGGMVHCLLPLSTSDPEKAKTRPGSFVDSGVVALLNELIARGANKKNLVITVAGGSNINDANNIFEIGKRNYTVLRKILWKNSLLIKAEHIGDSIPRTVSLNIGSGEVWITINRETKRLL